MMQTPALWKRAGALVAAGLPGVAMLALQPIPGDWLQAQPELQLWPAWKRQALLMLNPLVLLVLAAWCGALTAHRVGLYSVLAGTAGPESRQKGWALAAAVGLCSGVGLVVLDQIAAPWLGAPWERFLQQGSQPSVLVLGTGILYGGITEEILMRWGLMGSVTWALWALTGKRHPVRALVVAAVVTAGVFGAGHLPVLATQVELTSAVVARTLALNGLAALVYAWVFCRHHLEAAMLCHACTHAAMGAVWALT
jgi:hypothetical protein